VSEPASVSDRQERGAPGEDQREWLVLVYKVPSEPTRLRATVWRRLKGLGAIYLQNSAAALPAGVSAERALKKLRHEIVDMSGTAILLRSTLLAGGAAVFEAFAAARDDEYGEIVDKCQDFLAGIEKEFTHRGGRDLLGPARRSRCAWSPRRTACGDAARSSRCPPR